MCSSVTRLLRVQYIVSLAALICRDHQPPLHRNAAIPTTTHARMPPPSGINHRALHYAHVASSLRGCSFPISADTHRPEDLERLLPYIGRHTSEIILDLFETGTCAQLAALRSDRPAPDSKGELRYDSAGAATRRRFTKLPGVGVTLARRWYDMGEQSEAGACACTNTLTLSELQCVITYTSCFHRLRLRALRYLLLLSSNYISLSSHSSSSSPGYRTYEDLEAAATPGPGGAPAAIKLGTEVAFTLRHRHDLLEDVTSEEVAEMRAAVVAAFEAASGFGGWEVTQVGRVVKNENENDTKRVFSSSW